MEGKVLVHSTGRNEKAKVSNNSQSFFFWPKNNSQSLGVVNTTKDIYDAEKHNIAREWYFSSDGGGV